jgi:hypothetical protein
VSGGSTNYLAGWLAARQLFVALIVTAATLLANRSVIVIPGTPVRITDGFVLDIFDLVDANRRPGQASQATGCSAGARVNPGLRKPDSAASAEFASAWARAAALVVVTQDDQRTSFAACTRLN